MLPVIHRLQSHAPETKITWIIGRIEHKLVGALPGVEFIVFDKRGGWRAFWRLRQVLAKKRFDVLLLMQVALRANLLSLCVKAKRRIGFDAARAKDLHACFINERIPAQENPHVLDGFLSFVERLGVPTDTPLSWSLPVREESKAFASQHKDERPLMIISPCSSHVLRNWHAEGYAALADYASQQYEMKVVICGGGSALERAMAKAICQAAQSHPVNLVGQDTFPQFIELLRVSRVLVSPDSGPAHMAAITDTPVLGLYAASNPHRSGPYKSIPHCVDTYPQAVRQKCGKSLDALAWGSKMEYPGVMNLIGIEQVKKKLDEIMNNAITGV